VRWLPELHEMEPPNYPTTEPPKSVEVGMPLKPTPHSRRTALLLALLLLPAVVPLRAQEPVQKKPVPDNAAQGQAEATIVELFAAKFKEAKADKEAARDLAAHMLQRSLATEDDDPLRYMGLKLSADLAARAGDHALALQAIGELTRSFQVDTI